MLPYWLLFASVAWLAASRSPQTVGPSTRWPALWRISFVVLVLMIGLRHEVGGDWGQYLRLIGFTQFGTFVFDSDPAYVLLDQVATEIGGGIYLINTVCAAFFSFGLISFCRAQPRPWLALAVAVPYLVIVVAMGYTRQAAALGIVMAGLVALSEQKPARYVISVALAASFHKSAVVLMPLAVLAGRQRRIFTAIWVTASAALCYSFLLKDSVSMLNTNYILAQYQSGGAPIRVAMNAIPALIFLFFRQRFDAPQTDLTFWTWMSFGGLCFVAWLATSPSSTAVDRMALYWIPLQLFVFSRLPDALGKKGGFQTLLGILAYSAAVQFTWLEYATNAAYWVPYQFYPFVLLWQ